MKLVVFGANGPTGRLLTRQALTAGHAVTAVTRRPRSFPISGPGLRVAGADVLEEAAVSSVVAGHDAVISTLGVPYTRETVRVYSEGAANIVAAMREHGLRRLVCVSSTGTTGELPEGETFTFRWVIAPILLRLGRTVYADMSRMERTVAASGLDWTVVRPAGLFDAPGVTAYRAEPRRLPGRFTSRADLADLLLREATGSESRNGAGEGSGAGRGRRDGYGEGHVGCFLDVVTVTGAPTFAGMFAREALHLGRRRDAGEAAGQP